jgi:hypothetical protein
MSRESLRRYLGPTILAAALALHLSPSSTSTAEPSRHQLYLPRIDLRPDNLPTVIVAGQSNALTGWVEKLGGRVPGWYIQTAESATRISQWAPDSPLYKRLIELSKNRNSKLIVVLWWQGESDVVEGTDSDDYKRRLAEFALAIKRDLGIPIMVAEIGPEGAWPTPDLERVRKPQRDCWRECENVIQGPSFADIEAHMLKDNLHFRMESEINLATERWYAALLRAGYVISQTS